MARFHRTTVWREVSPNLVAVWKLHMVHQTRLGLHDTAHDPHRGHRVGVRDNDLGDVVFMIVKI